jgi:hypothetical protein
MRRVLIGLPLAGFGLGFLLLALRNSSAPSQPRPLSRPEGRPSIEVGIPLRSDSDRADAPKLDTRKTGCLVGTVLTRAALPVPGASVAVLQVSPAPGVALHRFTDGDGHFRIEGIPLGLVSLHIDHARYRPIHLDRISLQEDGGILELDLVLEEGTTISGRVRDDLGLPLEGVSLIVANEIIKTTLSDNHGLFSVSGLGVQKVHVIAIAPGFGSTTVRDLPPGSAEAELRLSPGGILSGAIEADPLPQAFTVHLRSRDDNRGSLGRLRTQTFQDQPGGAFRIEDLPEGVYDVELDVPGFEVLDAPQVFVSGKRKPDELRIRLRRRD